MNWHNNLGRQILKLFWILQYQTLFNLNSWACTWKVFRNVQSLCTHTPNYFFHLFWLFSKLSTNDKTIITPPVIQIILRHFTFIIHYKYAIGLLHHIKEHKPNRTKFPFNNSSNTFTIWNNHKFKLHSWINSIHPAIPRRPDEHTSMHLFTQHCIKRIFLKKKSQHNFI